MLKEIIDLSDLFEIEILAHNVWTSNKVSRLVRMTMESCEEDRVNLKSLGKVLRL
jgi:hypothetical protein